MKKTIITAIGILMNIAVQAQDMESVIRLIEKNNREILAQQRLTDREKINISTRNTPENPSVEYSPFFEKGTDGIAASEMVVSMGFDFPTLYSSRQRSALIQYKLLDHRQQAFRQEKLLQAKEICLELIMLNQEHTILVKRLGNATELLELFKKRMESGDATQLEINKIKMEVMNIRTEMASNSASHRTALQQLISMNAGLPIEFSGHTYPEIKMVQNYNQLYDEVMASDHSLQTYSTALQAAEKELHVKKQQWLPKIEIGYRRNTAMQNKSNGFLIGGSIPLFSNRKEVRMAEFSVDGSRLFYENAHTQKESELQSRFNEIRTLEETLAAYDRTLMYETLELLKKAVVAGQISIITYYMEADSIYLNLDTFRKIEYRYQKLAAQLLKYRL